MLRFHNYDIVFQEIPGEVTLAINISNCPNRCKGCHSPHLQDDKGEILDESALENLLEKYGNAITCVCFMGGDGSPDDVLKLARFVRRRKGELLFVLIKTAWYSGKPELYQNAQHYFDYIKLGKYIEKLGGLNSPTTNQRFYRIENATMIDMTDRFYKH
ncbi:MAG: anaerobic ribonucleoside-triphosphate reductase activating protein [Prevotellaceae bacterium]|jgi:anaerobic ribonucleoside-triphosphate reductase activating protein|nr:anaerobic ribonucleoside-triphosphate reductase activating protein [Prevotellaceae bacterium]